MDSSAIDPSLREVDVDETGLSADAPNESFVFAETADNHDVDNTDHVLAQHLANEGLPYAYDQSIDPLPEVTAQPEAPFPQQKIQFKAHEPRRRPRSCESCRGLKVKCEPNETGDGPCKRCQKAGRECNYTEASGRRKKKHENQEDTVAALQREVAALRAQTGFHPEIPDGAAVNGTKRSHSEFEQDLGDKAVMEVKHLKTGVAPADIQRIIGFAKIHKAELDDLRTRMQTINTAFLRYQAEHPKPIANGKAGKNGPGAAPTAKMGSNPLDLLSQAANTKASKNVYSPYSTATATQETIGQQEDLLSLFNIEAKPLWLYLLGDVAEDEA